MGWDIETLLMPEMTGRIVSGGWLTSIPRTSLKDLTKNAWWVDLCLTKKFRVEGVSILRWVGP